MNNLKKGLFVGLSTLDFIYFTDHFFSKNEKIVAVGNTITAGDLASNAGEKPMIYLSNNDQNNIDIEQIKAVDTLGGGDIFHGAFCYYILEHSFTDSLVKASQIASKSCQYFGTRKWME